MSARSDPRSLIRRSAPGALVPAAALGVHQLRYWLAFGSQSGLTLARQGHDYLHSVAPWLVLLIGLAVGAFLRGLGQAFAGQRSPRRFAVSFAVLWLACAAALLVVYTLQEFLEGLMATGHPAGLAGIFGYGGWWAVPAAVAISLVLAALLHGARWVLDGVGRRHDAAPARRRLPPGLRPRLAPFAPSPAPVVAGWSGRGPPA